MIFEDEVRDLVSAARRGYFPKGATPIYRTFSGDRLDTMPHRRVMVGIHIKSKGRTGAGARFHLQRGFKS